MSIRLIKRYLKILLSYYVGRPLYQPDSVSLAITEKCNLRCKMCEYWKQDGGNRRPLSLQECKSLFNDLTKYGVKKIQFTGGEPLARPDLFSIFGAAKSNGLEITLITNGTLINERNYESIVDLVDSVYISLDTPQAEVHDHIRGIPRTFERATEAIRLLSKGRVEKDRKMRITICSIITIMSLHNPREMLNLIKNLGADRLIYNPAAAASYGYSNLKSDFANESTKMAKYNKMVDIIIELMDKDGATIKSNPFYLESSKKFLLGDKRYFYFPCYSGGYNGPLINYDGEVFPCCAWNFSLGNIRQNPFSHIWKSEEAKRVRKRIRNKDCPMCHHHTRTFDYIIRALLLVKNPARLWRGYIQLIKS